MVALAQPLANPADVWWQALGGGETRAALALLESETMAGRTQRSVYELFAEMEEKDGHLYAVLQTRMQGLLALERSVHPREESVSGRAAAQFVRDALAAIPRFEEMLRALLDALAKGFAVVELLWDYDRAGKLVVRDWIAHPQEAFVFDARGRLFLLSPPFRGQGVQESHTHSPGRSVFPALQAFLPPACKFLALSFGRDARNPYGRGLCQRAYWYYWFKKNNLKFWAIFNEKYGAPTAVATCQAGTTEQERRRVLEVLDALQTEAGVVLPEHITLQFLEASGRGEGRSYREMADWCNDEISKIVLGGTLTSSEGRRSGSLALGSVHNAVRQDYIEADARLLAAVIGDSLVRWLIELNAPGAPVPSWQLDSAPPENLLEQVRVDRELVALGVPVPVSHFYQRYGRPHPAPDERTLRFDDSNLFQYHLRFGVLTVNEVRARLHLPPVPWGDRPPQLDAASDNAAIENTGNTTDASSGLSREDSARGEGREQTGENTHERDPFEP